MYINVANPAHTPRLRITATFLNLLVIINCSANFVVYSILSTKFRRTFNVVFCRHRHDGKYRNHYANNTTGFLSLTPVNARRTTLSAAVTARSSPGGLSRSCQNLYLHPSSAVASYQLHRAAVVGGGGVGRGSSGSRCAIVDGSGGGTMSSRSSPGTLTTLTPLRTVVTVTASSSSSSCFHDE